MSHFCCSRSPAPSWFTSQAAAVLLTRAIRAFLLDHPGATLARAAILQYRPVNTDVLPIFVLLHLLFAPLLWLLLRVPNATLGASLALYALVHAFGWTVPAWPNGHWAFNPLAWQLLVVLGAWWMIEDKRVRPWVTSRTALVLAVLYLLFSLVIALSWRIKPLEALIPQALAKLLYPLDKSNLDPLRLLHFLAIAVLAAWFVPRNWRGLTTPVMRGAIRCGQNSLPIYCLGVLLAFASHMALLDISDGLAMQIALSLAWHRSDDRDRNAAELDQHQTQAAIVIFGHCDQRECL